MELNDPEFKNGYFVPKSNLIFNQSLSSLRRLISLRYLFELIQNCLLTTSTDGKETTKSAFGQPIAFFQQLRFIFDQKNLSFMNKIEKYLRLLSFKNDGKS